MKMNFKQFCNDCQLFQEARRKPKGKRRKTGRWSRPRVLPLLTLGTKTIKQPAKMPVAKPNPPPPKVWKVIPTLRTLTKKSPTGLTELVGNNRPTLKDVKPAGENNTYGALQKNFPSR
ncbi:MAG: hypothetical protein WCL54_08385 [Clostridia bacterium]